MKRRISVLFIFISLISFSFLGLTSTPTPSVLSATVTPVPRIKVTEVPLDARAGHSEGILIMGILIFLIIAVPIVYRYWNSRKTKL